MREQLTQSDVEKIKEEILEARTNTAKPKSKTFPKLRKKLKTPLKIREKYKAEYLKVSPKEILSSTESLL